MACGTLCLLKPVIALAGIAAVGIGGYNLASTGCVLGSCGSDQTANMTAASTPADACPMGGCSEEKAGHTAMLAADAKGVAECPSGAAPHCSDAMKAACETAGECPMGSEACADMDPAACADKCETECEPLPAEQVAEGAEVEQVNTAGDAG